MERPASKVLQKTIRNDGSTSCAVLIRQWTSIMHHCGHLLGQHCAAAAAAAVLLLRTARRDCCKLHQGHLQALTAQGLHRDSQVQVCLAVPLA